MATPAPRLPLPRFVQIGRAETVDVQLYGAGGTVAATSGTYALYDSDGAEVIAPTATTASGKAMTFDLPSTFASGYDAPQHAWRERWVLSGVAGAPAELTIEQEVHVCRVAPLAHVTVEDLYRMHASWRRQIPQVYSSNVDQPIDVAWEEMIGRLLGDEQIPHRALNWWALSVVHKYWAAHIVCRDFATDQAGDSRWERLSEDYWQRANDEYEHHLGLRSDDDEDGVADTPEKLDAAEPQLFLTDVPWHRDVGGHGWR